MAVSAVSAMSDRLCIHSKGKIRVSVSAEDLMSCCTDCGFGCYGGYLGQAWRHWVVNGIATGGGHNSSKGCKAYSFPPCKSRLVDCDGMSPTPVCSPTCDNGSRSKATHTFGKTFYRLAATTGAERQIQLEIMMNGPVESGFLYYQDFIHYKNGVYQHVTGTMISKRAIKIVGWGIEAGTPYWLVANTWGSRWGDNGFFKVRRGHNECGIETEIYAGLPQPSSSPISNFYMFYAFFMMISFYFLLK